MWSFQCLDEHIQADFDKNNSTLLSSTVVGESW